MRKNFTLFIIITFLITNHFKSFTQNKILSLQDIFTKRELYAFPPSNLKWLPQTEEYSIEENNTLYRCKYNKNQSQEIITLFELNNILEKENITKLNRFPEITWKDKNTFWFLHESAVIAIDINNKKITTINKYSKEASEEHVHPTTLTIAYVKDNNIYISENSVEKQITFDGKEGIVNGKAAHRQEFGINKGIFWNNSGTMFAFYRIDETMVTDYPLITYSNLSNRVAEIKNIKYPMTGMKSHHATIGVYNLKTNNTIFLKTGEPADQYLTNITWSKDDKYIYVAIVNRQQNHMKLVKYDVTNGMEISTLFEEKNDKYIEPMQGPMFFNENNDEFLWFSKRDGWNHLYLYTPEGKLQKQVTKGKFDVQSFIGFDKKNRVVYFTAAHPKPIESNLFSVNLDNEQIKQISKDKGTHYIQYNEKINTFIDVYSNTETPNKSLIINNTGNIIKEISKLENTLKDYKKCEINIFTIKANDGTDLWCRMIKPIDFDENKKYPVFYYVYGGPHVQMIQDEWLNDLFMLYMAHQGFVVFSLDNRGTPNRGLEFEQAIYRNLGKIEVEDQMKGVEYLKSLPWIDKEKFSLHGWSYGGFMTLSMMLKYPNVFKVAVAGGPVIDWQWYEVMYGERYMDTPEENPEGYKEASLLNYVKNLKGKLLLIHGGLDDTVVPQHSLSFINKCIEEGVLIDFFIYPEHEHNIRGKDRLHLYKKIEQYIKENLKM